MTSHLVEVAARGRVLEITLNRPKVNAINGALSQAIHAAVRRLQDDEELTVGILTAKGERVFSAGWDFNEPVAAFAATGSAFADAEERRHGPGGFAGITRWFELTKPLICAVNGAAVGGGFEMALACDVIVAAEQAWFELPEMQRGILPEAGGLQRLPRLVPYNVAMEMLLSGRRMAMAEAAHWGLVHKVLPPAELLPYARDLADRIASGAPLALQALKEAMRALDGVPLPQAMRMFRPGEPGLPWYDRMSRSSDAAEGPRAFLEKRPPRWQGR